MDRLPMLDMFVVDGMAWTSVIAGGGARVYQQSINVWYLWMLLFSINSTATEAK